MLADLRAEREQIEQAILAIERLAVGTRGKRRGRRPKWMSSVVPEEATAAATFSTKRTLSTAARKRIAEAQKKRWAAKKAQAKPSAS